MKVKKIIALLLSCLFIFPAIGCSEIATTNQGIYLEWKTKSNLFEVNENSKSTEVDFKVKSDNVNYVYTRDFYCDENNDYFNINLMSDVSMKTKIVFEYRSSGKTKKASATLDIEEKNILFSIDISTISNKSSISQIQLYPANEKDGKEGMLTIGKIYFSPKCVGEEYTLKRVNESVIEEEEDEIVIPENATYLYEKYQSYFKVGMVADYSRYRSYADIESHFNSFTCENEMKLYTIGNNQNSYDYSKGDQMLDYMISKGKFVRGHALIWYQSAPGWLTGCNDKTELLKRIDTYCYNVVKHYAEKYGDKVYCWDVVNEAVADGWEGNTVKSNAAKIQYGNNAACNPMRNDFYHVAGIDYIKTAFIAARRALDDVAKTKPEVANVKLFYNDYSITNNRAKKKTVYDIVAQLIESDIPIDGVGFQSHYDKLPSNVIETEEAITDFINLAKITNHPLEIHITELDVKTQDNNGLANFYDSLFALYRKYRSNIKSVTLWGVADGYCWLGNQYTPFLFDSSHNKKEAFNRVFNFTA